MTVEKQTVAVFTCCGYRMVAPPEPENMEPTDPNYFKFRPGDFGHDYAYMKDDCPNCTMSDIVYPYAEGGTRLLFQK